MSSDDLKRFKLFPANLTARADALVRGNPVTTRPDSGVENCFPGLEFDQRNLDKAFFPGLLFEFHHDAGVILRDFDPKGLAGKFFTGKDLAAGVFLLFIRGNFASRDANTSPRLLRFAPPAGLESWRFVRDLEPGPVAVVLCGTATYQSLVASLVDGQLEVAVIERWLEKRKNRRESAGELQFVLLFGERNSFLTEEGVIDPQSVGAGDLTRSLCSPWQYDFADCGCFYWASNKPDLVSSDAQQAQVLNFQRRDRSEANDRATRAEDWLLKHGGQWDGEPHILRHAEMMLRWQDLPFVVAGRETDRFTPSAATLPPRTLSREQVIERLKELAQVEHALAVEYLYAHYSLGIPRPEDGPQPDSRVRAAGMDVFHIAVDEMRHLRAVNEILIALDEEAVLGRATVIGRDYDRTGRAFKHDFVLAPLSAEHLKWFIEVERASQNDHSQNTIDGMYTLILRSIAVSAAFTTDEKQRLSQLIKVIIDEGMEHFRRFSRAQKALEGLAEAQYLKVRGAPTRLAENHPDRILQDTVDASYVVVLRTLDYVFKVADRQRGAMMQAATRAMYNMDDAARSLALRGHGALFDLSGYRAVSAAASGAAGARRAAAAELGSPLNEHFARLEGSADPRHRELAGRMRGGLEQMTRELEALASR